MLFIAHDRKPAHEDEESSIRDRLILKHVTTKALEALGGTLNFIEIWLKLLEHNYEVRFGMYDKAMK